MAVGRSGGALAALAFAGIAYLWKNRKQVSNTVKDLGQNVQNRLSPPESTTTTDAPNAYTGETTRI